MHAILLSDLHVTGDLPSIDDTLRLCKNLQTMRVLCYHFLPCVIRKKWWKMLTFVGKKINDIAMVSDEKLVPLRLKNIWHDMMELNYWPRKMKKSRMVKSVKVPKIPIHLLFLPATM